MSSKIEACKTCNGTGIEYDGAGHACTACNGIAAPVVERQQAILPCDVKVAPNTTIKKGCKVETLLGCIELRKGQPDKFTRFKNTAPPELAELQATIAQLESKLNRAINLDFERRAEIERLKGGQGEPVAWANDQQLLLCSKSPREDQPNNPMLHNLPRNIAGSSLKTDYCNTPLFTSQPAPVSVDLSELREYHAKAVYNLKGYADDAGLRDSDIKHYTKRAAFHEGMVALIDKVKELNQSTTIAGFKVVEDPTIPENTIRLCNCNQGRLPCTCKG